MKRALAIKWTITFSAIAAIIFHVVFPKALVNDQTTIVLLIAAFLPWLTSLVDEAAFPGGWSVKFRQLEQDTNILRSRLDRLILMSLSDRLRKELKDFNTDNLPGKVQLIPAYRSELEHLHHRGFLRFLKGTNGFDDIPYDCHDIYVYLSITELGRDYLELAKEAWEEKHASK
jgi:hypothetical protein